MEINTAMLETNETMPDRSQNILEILLRNPRRQRCLTLAHARKVIKFLPRNFLVKVVTNYMKRPL